jgi:hypothetical protein
MAMMAGNNASFFVVGQDGEHIPIGPMQEVQIEYDVNLDENTLKRINYEGSFNGTMEVDRERIEQLVAKLTPYSRMFKSIRMPDGKYLTRGKNRGF